MRLAYISKISIGRDMGREKSLFSAGTNVNRFNTFGEKTKRTFFKKPGIELSYDLASLFLDIYPQSPQIPFTKDICTPCSLWH